MVFVVPFDGSKLSTAALVRAVEFSTVLEEDVHAVSVIPEGNNEYARERDWIGPDERFDLERVVARLHRQVTEVAPSADFRHETVEKYAPPGQIASELQNLATEVDATMVFVGSENAGRIVTGIGSVGARVAAEADYDVVIVRNSGPAKVGKLREKSPYGTEKSDFHFPQ
jgi:nucleotide-binding universal stress UspA family protein